MYASIAAVAALFLQSILMAIAGARALSGMEARLKDKISEHKNEFYQEITKIYQEFERMRREYGEVNAALREKVNQVELEAAKVYMRRDSAQGMKSEIMEQVRDLGDDLKERLDKIEHKVDQKLLANG